MNLLQPTQLITGKNNPHPSSRSAQSSDREHEILGTEHGIKPAFTNHHPDRNQTSQEQNRRFRPSHNQILSGLSELLSHAQRNN